MLEVLRIKNIAIIDSAEISFKQGLNIISGETGAGKSIVIEAISLLLGSRASSDLIRSGCDEAVVEGLFCISEIPWMAQRLERAGFEHSQAEMVIKRTVHRSGRHRITVNGELATLTTLHSICEGLIDLCGQHEHQSLLRAAVQLELVDRYGNLAEQVKCVSEAFFKYSTLSKKISQLKTAEHEFVKRRDFLKFQLDEIKQTELEPDEDVRLQAEKQLLQSTGTRIQAAEGARESLESEEQGALQALRVGLQRLRVLSAVDPSVQPIVEGLERCKAEAEDASISLNRYLSKLDLDPSRLQTVQERLSKIADLRRKYGSSVNAILETLSNLEAEFSSLDSLTEDLEKLEEELAATETEFRKLGKKLSSTRKKFSEVFAQTVTQELKDLKMNEARLLIDLSLKENVSNWNHTGGDQIQFLVQTNPGEPTRPLGRIASGGELSRLMLAIRRVIADRGGIGVYLFDEIDAGIGGQTAFQVGKKLKSVSQFNQVICITHLPQVASFADNHLVVKKSVVGKRTLTEITELTSDDRKSELARMLGGPLLTKRSLANASELLELARGGVAC